MSLQFRPNLEKIVELLLYLAHKKPGSDKYQAVKFFYLADREHLNRYGRPITFEEYFALPYGPVASKAKELIEHKAWTMRSAGLKKLPFLTEDVERSGRVVTAITAPLREVDRDIFSKSDLRVFDEVLERYGDCDFEELFQLTHDHQAYKKAWANRGASKRSPMTYDDMIEDPVQRQRIISEIGPVASHL